MIVETVLSMLTLFCHFKKVMHRTWECFKSRLAIHYGSFQYPSSMGRYSR